MDEDTLRPALLDRLTEVLTLELSALGDDDPAGFAALALDAVAAMTTLLRPLALEVTLACADPVSGYPRAAPVPPDRARFVVPRELPDGVAPVSVYTDAIRTEVAVLDTATAYDVVLRGLGQRCPGRDEARAELVTTWVELLVTASAVRLPAGLTTALDGADAVELAGGAATAPLQLTDGQAWVAGPRRPSLLWAPIEIAVRNEAGLLTLTVFSAWSLWTQDGAGAEDLREVEDRLRVLGWVRETG